MPRAHLLLALAALIGFCGFPCEAVRCNCLFGFCDFGRSSCKGGHCVIVEHSFLPFHLEKCGDEILEDEECYQLKEEGVNFIKPTRVCFCNSDYCNAPKIFLGYTDSSGRSHHKHKHDHDHLGRGKEFGIYSEMYKNDHDFDDEDYDSSTNISGDGFSDIMGYGNYTAGSRSPGRNRPRSARGETSSQVLKTVNIEVIIQKETKTIIILLVVCLVLIILILALCVSLLYNLKRIRTLLMRVLDKAKTTVVKDIRPSSGPGIPSAPPRNPSQLFVKSNLPFSPPPYRASND